MKPAAPVTTIRFDRRASPPSVYMPPDPAVSSTDVDITNLRRPPRGARLASPCSGVARDHHAALGQLAAEPLDLGRHGVVLHHLSLEERRRNVHLLLDPLRRHRVCVRELVLAVPEVAH